MNRLAVRAYAVGLAVLAATLTLILLGWNGALGPVREPGVTDPGAITRLGLPVVRVLRDLSAALTIGALVLTATVLPPASRGGSGTITGSRARSLNVAAASGAVWVWSGVAYLVLSYADIIGLDPLAPDALANLGSFVTDVELGRALLASVGFSSVTALGAMFARRTTAVGLLALCALAALWPLATTAHGGALNHDVAVNAQFAHLVGAAVWVGALAALVLVYRDLPSAVLPVVVKRFSVLAGWGIGLVAISGVLAAALRLRSVDDVVSNYGLLVLAKVTALLTLGAAGWVHRRRLIPRLGEDSTRARAFGRLAAAELALMAATIGIAVALSLTPPPTNRPATSAAQALLGYSMPPALGVAEFFTQWRLDSFWFPLAAIGIGLYLVAVRRLRHRGDRWPVGRTVSWLVGTAMLIWATSGSPGVYGRVLFSMHMAQHMTIAAGAPIFLAMGAPITLALRTMSMRTDGSRGPREWLLLLLHSRFLRVLGHPLVAAAVFIVSLVVFYSSSLFEVSLRSHTMHLLMVAHFLISGFLFASAICGVDPVPVRLPHPFRGLLLMVTFGFHALFSVSLMAKTEVLAEDWFSALGRTWGANLLEDQYAGATLGWILGDYPVTILGIALIWSWVRSDMREATRYDRRARRDNDEERRSYNAYLQSLARQNVDSTP